MIIVITYKQAAAAAATAAAPTLCEAPSPLPGSAGEACFRAVEWAMTQGNSTPWNWNIMLESNPLRNLESYYPDCIRRMIVKPSPKSGILLRRLAVPERFSRTYVCVLYIYIYIYTHAHTYVYVYAYIYIYTHLRR